VSEGGNSHSDDLGNENSNDDPERQISGYGGMAWKIMGRSIGTVITRVSLLLFTILSCHKQPAQDPPRNKGAEGHDNDFAFHRI
jgi:hypothetical protein